MKRLPINTVLVGDARQQLRLLPKSSVHACVTSPPYWNLRSYDHPEQLGLESTIDHWVAHLVGVFDEVARVLRDDGTLWLNVADSYVRSNKQGTPKNLALGPERLLMALVNRGWRPRNRIAWTKPNPSPSSVKDRLTSSWEYVYLLTRSETYYFDLDAIRVPHSSIGRPASKDIAPLTGPRRRPSWAGPLAGDQSGLARLKALGRPGHVLGKNPSDHWNLATSNFRSVHHATFPERLVERPILAGTPERACAACGRGWRRQPPELKPNGSALLGAVMPSCNCRADSVHGVVLDPFMGSGTTAVVAERLGRSWIGCEINPEFANLTVSRVRDARDRMAA